MILGQVIVDLCCILQITSNFDAIFIPALVIAVLLESSSYSNIDSSSS